MLIIQANQDEEIRRITVRSHPRQIIPKNQSLKTSFIKKGWWSGLK
jgi:hypothetical protein